jgi:hypothetical protein
LSDDGAPPFGVIPVCVHALRAMTKAAGASLI